MGRRIPARPRQARTGERGPRERGESWLSPYLGLVGAHGRLTILAIHSRRGVSKPSAEGSRLARPHEVVLISARLWRMSRLDLTLLGGFEVRTEVGATVVVPTRKAQGLVAYLALTPGLVHPRDKLTALLWPEAAPGAARNALRQTLFVLR